MTSFFVLLCLGFGSRFPRVAAASVSMDTSFVLPVYGRDLEWSVGTARDQSGAPFSVGPKHYVFNMTVFPQQAVEDIKGRYGEFIVDTGSGVSVAYLNTAGADSGCGSTGEDTVGTSPNLSTMYTYATKNSNTCAEFEYSVSNPLNDTCIFRVSFAGGEEAQGFVIKNAYMYVDGSQQILGSVINTTDNQSVNGVVTTLNGGVLPLYSPFVVGGITSSSCATLPGLVGMDTSENAFVSQLVANGKIKENVFSICSSRQGMYGGTEAGILIMGPGVPSLVAETLSTFPLYNGKTIVNVKTESDEFGKNVASLDVRGLDSHFFVISDSVRVGDSTFQGPLDTLLDSGYDALGLRSDIFDALNQQIAANAESKGYMMSREENCIIASNITNQNAMAIAEDIAPTIQVSLSDTVTFDIEGINYMTVSESAPQEYLVCNAITVSQSDETVVLGTSFFVDRFVQFDWENQVLRVADVTSCPSSTSPSSETFTVASEDATSMTGFYSFPFRVVSGCHPVCSLLSQLLICFSLLLSTTTYFFLF